MNRKNRGLLANFGKIFKGLPPVKRIRFLFITRKLLKLQREKKALFEDGGNVVEGNKGGRR